MSGVIWTEGKLECSVLPSSWEGAAASASPLQTPKEDVCLVLFCIPNCSCDTALGLFALSHVVVAAKFGMWAMQSFPWNLNFWQLAFFRKEKKPKPTNPSVSPLFFLLSACVVSAVLQMKSMALLHLAMNWEKPISLSCQEGLQEDSRDPTFNFDNL